MILARHASPVVPNPSLPRAASVPATRRPVTVLVEGVVVAVDLVAREHVVDDPVAVVIDAVVLAPAT